MKAWERFYNLRTCIFVSAQHVWTVHVPSVYSQCICSSAYVCVRQRACVCMCACVFSETLKVSGEVIIPKLYPGLEHKWLHSHIDFLSLQMEIHTEHQIWPHHHHLPLSRKHTHMYIHKLILLKLMNDPKVNGSKVWDQTTFLSGHWWFQLMAGNTFFWEGNRQMRL